MTINREISQFASFVNVDDATKNIGIATTSTPSIGIGTANPSAKFEVVGDTKLQSLNVTGITTIGVSSTSPALRVTQTGTGDAILVEDSANPDSSPFVVTETGKVGIGTTNPSPSNNRYQHINNLVIRGNDSASQRGITIDTYGGSNSQPSIAFQQWVVEAEDTKRGIIEYGPRASSTKGEFTFGDAFYIEPNSSETIGISSNIIATHSRTNIGIGTTNPTAKLDVRGDVTVSGLTSTGSLRVVGVSTFLQGIDVKITAVVNALTVFPGPSNLSGQTNLYNALNVAGITTLASSGGITTTGGNLYVGDNLYVKNNLISGSISYSGVAATNFTVSETLTARRISIGGTATVGISFTDSNIRIGDVYTGSSITSGTHNNFIGNSAGLSNTTGRYNNFFGLQAGYYNTTGCHNNFIGNSAGLSNTTGTHNNFFGNSAGRFNTTGCHNNFIGCGAGRCNTTGCHNNFIGCDAGRCNTSGCNNIAIGNSAGYCNTTGCNNNFIGNSAGYCNTSGCNNNFIGNSAGRYNTSGCNNIAIGNSAGYENTTGCNNNFFGNSAGYANTTGTHNNFFGCGAGLFNTSGCNNIAIGKHAGTTGLIPSGLINLTTTGNQIAIGNTDITNFYTKMAAKAFAYTTVKWDSTTFELAADTSSCRFKTNIRPFLGGVAELLAIESVRYNPIEKPDGLDEVGFIAEQIDEIGLTEFVCYDIEEKPLSVSYDRMAALLVNAIKELDTENTLLKIRLEALETHVGIATNA